MVAELWTRDFNNRNDDKQLIIQTSNSQLPLADGHWSLPKWEWIDYDGSDAVLKEWMICSTWESMLIRKCFEFLSDPVIPSFLYDLSSWFCEISTTSTTLLPCCAPARCELCWRLHPTSSRWGRSCRWVFVDRLKKSCVLTKNDKQKMLFLTLVLWCVRHQKYMERSFWKNLTALSHCCVFLADRVVADVPSSSFQGQRQPPIFQQGRAPLLDIVFWHMTSIS